MEKPSLEELLTKLVELNTEIEIQKKVQLEIDFENEMNNAYLRLKERKKQKDEESFYLRLERYNTRFDTKSMLKASDIGTNHRVYGYIKTIDDLIKESNRTIYPLLEKVINYKVYYMCEHQYNYLISNKVDKSIQDFFEEYGFLNEIFLNYTAFNDLVDLPEHEKFVKNCNCDNHILKMVREKQLPVFTHKMGVEYDYMIVNDILEKHECVCSYYKFKYIINNRMPVNRRMKSSRFR